MHTNKHSSLVRFKNKKNNLSLQISVLGQAPPPDPKSCTSKKDCPRGKCCVSAATSREKREADGTAEAPTGVCQPMKQEKQGKTTLYRNPIGRNLEFIGLEQ